jgi:hypothetical protein
MGYIVTKQTYSLGHYYLPYKTLKTGLMFRGRIFSHVRPLYEQAVGDLDRPMHSSLWV